MISYNMLKDTVRRRSRIYLREKNSPLFSTMQQSYE